MKQRDLSQPDLEKDSGVGQSTISRILDEGTNLGIEKLAAVAQALGVQPWELLVEDESAYEEVLRRVRAPRQDSDGKPPR